MRQAGVCVCGVGGHEQRRGNGCVCLDEGRPEGDDMA